MACAYPVYEVPCENQRLVLVTDIHHCHGDWYETQSDDRMTFLCSCLEAMEGLPGARLRLRAAVHVYMCVCSVASVVSNSL